MQCQLSRLAVNYVMIGAGRPLVMISGIPSDHQIIASWMEPLLAERPGWRRIYFDLPGTGLTPSAGLTSIDEVLDVCCEFIESLLPGQNFTLAGLSVGGYLARGVVNRMAERVDGVALLVPWWNLHAEQDLPAPVAFVQDAQALAQLSPNDARLLGGLAVVQDQKMVDWYRHIVIAAREQGEGILMERYTFSFQPEDPARPFQKPALILTARQDAHVGYRDALDILDFYPRATLAVLDRAGHAVGVEQETLFRTLLNEWLDRVQEYRP